MKTNQMKTLKQHESVIRDIIINANETDGFHIISAYDLVKKIWFFVNSDNANFKSKKVSKDQRINYVIPNLIEFYYGACVNREVRYSMKQQGFKITENDFIDELKDLIVLLKEEQKDKESTILNFYSDNPKPLNELPITVSNVIVTRKYNKFLEYIETRINKTKLEKEQHTKKIVSELKNGIENLERVVCRFETFTNNLRLHNEDKIYSTCHALQRDFDFKNICHKAKKEIEYLSINHNKDVIQSYSDKVIQINTILLKWSNNELKDSFKMNEVNISLVPIEEVVNELKKYSNNEIRNISQAEKIHKEDSEQPKFNFKNIFDDIPEDEVYTHFKTGLVDRKYIDEDKLKEFLKIAFEERQPPQEKIRLMNTTNAMGNVKKVFHKYYLKQVTKKGKKEKYVRLLTDYFIDFEFENVSNNFRS